MNMKKLAALVMALVLCLSAASAMAVSTIYYPKDTAYGSLQAAVDAINDGGTIYLTADCNGDGIITSKPRGNVKSFTLDLQTHTYTVSGKLVGSAGTESQAFHFEDSSATIKIKNGTLTSTKKANGNGKDGARLMLQNYANLTLDNVTIDGSNMNMDNGYSVASFNDGESKMIGETNILAAGPHGAISVSDYADYGGASLDIETTGLIKGAVEKDASEKAVIGVDSGIFTDFSAVYSYASDPKKPAAYVGAGADDSYVPEENAFLALGNSSISNAIDLSVEENGASETMVSVYQGSVNVKNVPEDVKVYNIGGPGTSATINGVKVPALTEEDYKNGNFKPYIVPGAAAKQAASLPQTGDTSSLLLWSALLAAAMVGYVTMGRKVRA